MAGRAEVTAAYRAGLLARRAGMLALLRGLWARLYDPAAPLPSLRLLGALAGVLIVRAQLAAATSAQGYLAALAPGEPIPVPAGLVGTAASGAPVADLAGQAPAVWVLRTAAGQAPETAALASQAWLNRLGVSEPYRVANQTVLRAVQDDDRFTGRVNRQTAPGACGWCAQIRDRGYLPAHAGFAAHANCRCTPEPETTRRVATRGMTARDVMAARAAAGDPEAIAWQQRQAAMARERARRQRQRARG